MLMKTRRPIWAVGALRAGLAGVAAAKNGSKGAEAIQLDVRVLGFDANKDGFLDASELLAFTRTVPLDDALQTYVGFLAALGGASDATIDRVVAFDANKDGKVTRAELPPAFQLAVDFEIKAPAGEAGRYRRPYVAIWVEDADGLAVRTLTLWVQTTGPGPRWIPDLKRWYKADQVRRLVDKTDLGETTSRATRPAGKYKVVWDGTDDRGQRLNQGEYTLSFEVAREHGTHQVIRKELTLGETPIAATLEGNVEIKAASVEYRRKAAAR